MPGTLQTGYKLDQAAVPPYEEMRGYLELVDFGKIGVCLRVEAIGEQLDDAVAAILAGRQTDIVDDRQRNRHIRSLVMIGRIDKQCVLADTVRINHPDPCPAPVLTGGSAGF